MSPAPPRFETLPYVIINMIIDYLPPPEIANAGETVTVPTMHICPRWRKAYTRKYFSTLVVRDQKDAGGGFSFKIAPLSVDPPIQKSDLIVRTLTVAITYWEPLMNGEIVEWMLTSPEFVNLDFSSVITLIVDLHTGERCHSSISSMSYDEVSNIAAFFSHIRSVVPNASNIKLLMPNCEQCLSTDVDTNLIDNSIAELVSGRNLTFDGGYSRSIFPKLNPAAIPNLTSLCYSDIPLDPDADITGRFFEISRHNADTLKSIKSEFDLVHLERFLFSDGLPIIYSSLVKADIEILDNSEMFRKSVNPISSRYSGMQMDHFPALKHLRLEGSYWMAIGHLLGSENRSVEYLHAAVFPLFPDYFNPSISCPEDMLTHFHGLKAINFSALDEYGYYSEEPPEYNIMCSHLFKSFAYSSPAIYCISTETRYGSNLLELLSDNNLWTTVGKIDVKDAVFSFVDISSLLRNAPALQHLFCGLEDIPPAVDGIDLRDHPEYLDKLQRPLSSSLLDFSVRVATGRDGEVDAYNVSLSALLVTSMCPRLRRARMSVVTAGKYPPDDFDIEVVSGISLCEQANSLFLRIIGISSDDSF